MSATAMPINKLRHASGSGLVIALASITPLIVIGGTILVALVTFHKETESRIGRSRARSIASSGIHDALATLNADLTFAGEYQVPLDGGTAIVNVNHWASDGVDNDDNGLTDDAAEDNMISIQSMGTLNAQIDADGNLVDRPVRSHTYSIRAIVEELELDVNFDQALYVDDEFAPLEFNGNSFLISGEDMNLDGTPGDQPARPALGAPGDISSILTQITPQQEDNFVGSSPSPSVEETDALDLSHYADQLASIAHHTWYESEADYSGTMGVRDPFNPIIAHATGDLDIHGNTTMTGFLVVEGDLEVSGNFDFAGVIIALGSLTFRGGGNKRIIGSVLTLGEVSGDGLEISGNIEMHYSAQALNAVVVVARLGMVAWLEN